MMDSVHHKVEHKENRAVGKDLVDVEQETMEEVFQKRPNEISEEKARKHFSP